MENEKSTIDLVLTVLYVICGIIVLFLIFGLINKKFDNSNEEKEVLLTKVSNVIELPVTNNNNIQTNKISNSKVDALDVILAKEHLTLKVGDEYSFKYSVVPSNSTDKTVSWSSSNDDVVSIDNNGKIKALKTGTSVITIKTTNNLSSTCTVVVKDNSNTVIDIKHSTDINVNSISLNKNNETVYVDSSLQLSVTFNPSNATNKNIKWTSSDDSIATVNNNGLVVTKKVGNVTITASANNGMYSVCKLNVVSKTSSVVEVSSISLNKTSESIYVGDSFKLSATINPSNATNKSVSWSSSNESAVKVIDGTVYGVGVGSATIIVKTNNGKTSTMSVNVISKNVGASSVTINSPCTSIFVDENVQLTASVNPSNATNKNVTWSSNNTNIAVVDSNGNVTGKSAGTVTITATSSNGINTYVLIRVKNKPSNAFGITLNKTSETIDVNKSIQLVANLTPSDTTNKNITWSSNDTNIAVVDSNGKVTGKNAGTTYIVATTSLGIRAKCKIIVKSNEIYVNSLTINKTSVDMYINSSLQLTVSINPSNATNRNITWSSSDSSIVMVDANGKIIGKKIGTAIITATSSNGKAVKCTVTVKNSVVDVTSLNLSIRNLNLTVGSTYKLIATVNPNNATNKNITWSSSDSNIATVSSTGVVKGISKGTAIITGKTNNGKIATCTVTVNGNNGVTYIGTSSKLTKSTAKELYTSPTLKYWVENNNSYNNYGISGFKVFHIWVEDPYNQFKTTLSNGNTYNSTGTAANSIFSNYVKTEGKGFVGTNGSFYVINNSPSEWSSTPRTAFIVYNGKVIRNDTNAAKANFNRYKSYNDVAGITQNGELAYYEVRNGHNNDRSIEYINKNIQKVVDDKVKYTVASFPRLVTNGKAVATSTSYKADRMFICQVDKNNFIMGYASSATESGLANFLANDMKCKTAVNIDGGGSCGMYYKGTGGVVNEKGNGRKIADVVYFEEK